MSKAHADAKNKVNPTTDKRVVEAYKGLKEMLAIAERIQVLSEQNPTFCIPRTELIQSGIQARIDGMTSRHRALICDFDPSSVERRCVKCRKVKTLSDFYRDATKANGFAVTCKQCRQGMTGASKARKK